MGWHTIGAVGKNDNTRGTKIWHDNAQETLLERIAVSDKDRQATELDFCDPVARCRFNIESEVGVQTGRRSWHDSDA